MYLRQKKSKILVFSEDEREYPRTPKDSGCCSLHWLPAGDLCKDYQPDDGPGILMHACSNCWYFNDRQLKYNKLDRKPLPISVPNYLADNTKRRRH